VGTFGGQVFEEPLEGVGEELSSNSWACLIHISSSLQGT